MLRFCVFIIIPICFAQETGKIVVDQNNQTTHHFFGFFKPTSPVPTSATVEHQPGVPPGWTTRPTRPTRPSRPTQLPPTNVGTVSHNNSNSRPVEGVIDENQEPDRGIVDWLLGIFPFRPPGSQQQSEVQHPARDCPPCVCGLTYTKTRIVGGIETKVNEYPWMTALMHNNRFYCGATLIKSNYLLTAGHCVSGLSKDRLSAVFLDHDRTSVESQTFTRKISKILRHAEYNVGGTYNNDIALLKLNEDVPLTGNSILRPVCLPPQGKSFTGHTAIATGWGATAAHGPVSNKLQEVRVPVISNRECQNTDYGSRITENMLCAGLEQGGKDSCQGDSGGPLHVVNGSSHVIVGIVSWGEGCAEPRHYGVYTRVNRFLTWIESNTKKDSCSCQSHSVLKL